ncbi:hypothetical protein ACIQUS_08900 [Pseudomonas sp. NPDC090755]|uniref:hypothetical protein n=1 Tax=Pseudomonas sp. NPDC090755 TaxID=3364481 RepID=UPI00383B6645
MPLSKREKTPTDIDKMRFDYAWKWFSFHAEQRTKMFNYMLVGLSILASGVVSTFNVGNYVLAGIICLVAVMLAAAFLILDCRNRLLYEVAQDVMIDAEGEYLFGENVSYRTKGGKSVFFGIAQRLHSRAPNKYDSISVNEEHGWPGVWGDIKKGRHKWWLPFIIVIFIFLFLAAGLFSVVQLISCGEKYDASGKETPYCYRPAEGRDAITIFFGSTSSNGLPAHTKSSPAEITEAAPSGVYGMPDRNAVFWLEVFSGLAIVALGGFLLYREHKTVGSILVVLGAATTSLLPHLSIPINFNSNFEAKIADSVEARLAEKIEGEVSFEKRISNPGPFQANMLSSVKFSGFGQGVESFNCAENTNKEKIAHVNSAIDDAQKRGLQSVVFLVGSTDRKPLSRRLRERFESNSGLARARVDAVKRCLDVGVAPGRPESPNAPEIVPLVTGPSYVPDVPDADGIGDQMMAEDRSVRVFVLAFPVHEKPALH